MTVFAFLTASQNMPFTVALTVMLLLTALEVASVSFGAGLSDFVDSVLPDFEADVDMDAGFDGADASPATISKLLSWFRVGEVPVLMLFIIFLTAFGCVGLLLQTVFQAATGLLLPALLASVPSFLAALPVVRWCGWLLGRYMPKDETYAVSEKSFIGGVATITTGRARQGSPAQAKLRDRHGQAHYVLVEPDEAAAEFGQGERVVLVSRQGAVFRAIRSDSAALNDT